MIETILEYIDKKDIEVMDAINQLKAVIEELNTKIEVVKQDTDSRINALVRQHELEKSQIEADIMLQLNALKDVTGKL